MRRLVFAAIAFAGLVGGYIGVGSYLGTLDAYSTQDCVVAPDAPRPTVARIASALGQAEDQGGWLVIGPKVCTMTPPVVAALVKADDPEVAPYITAIDTSRPAREQGCFINSFNVQKALQRTRGWSEERAFTEYFAMISAGIISGEWRFFSDSPLSTPASVQYVGEGCDDLAYADELAQSHAAFIDHYDAFVRANARYVTCEEGVSISPYQWTDAYATLGIGEPANGFHAFELFLMALGAGKIEGASLSERGTPRPPFCVFSAQGADPG